MAVITFNRVVEDNRVQASIVHQFCRVHWDKWDVKLEAAMVCEDTEGVEGLIIENLASTDLSHRVTKIGIRRRYVALFPPGTLTPASDGELSQNLHQLIF
jgi:hypothetical protein